MKNERLNRLIQLNSYKEAYNAIEKLEDKRFFCHHDIKHFFDVARIAWIYNIEQKLNLSQELVYSAAFLHDIGRHLQYTKDIPHHEASVILAVPMMEECGYSPEEILSIKEAILSHRSKEAAFSSHEPLSQILYRADKDSRNCFACVAESKCNWKREKKNMYITY